MPLLMMSDNLEYSLIVDSHNQHSKPSLLLAQQTELSQAKIKDAMQKGAVWLTRGNNKRRLRRATKPLKIGDKLELYYKSDLLSQLVPEPQLIHDAEHYSVWYKPYGLYCQGSRWGDFASINRWIEVNQTKLMDYGERPVHLVHRLDRATTGLILLCHSKRAAQLFSAMFEESKVDKRYQAIVCGDFSLMPRAYEVDRMVDGKSARSVFSNLKNKHKRSLLDVRLLTGRKHQIRQHLSAIGYPIVGDRLYGTHSEPDEDLQLQAVSLRFTCPITDLEKCYSVDSAQRLQL